MQKNTITADECSKAIGNISIPVGLIEAVRTYLDFFGISDFLHGLKSKGIDMEALTAALIVYSLSDDNSMAACARWLKDERVRKALGLKHQVIQRTLNRTLEMLGNNREDIILTLYRGLNARYPDLKKDVDADGSSIAAHSEGGLRKAGYARDNNPDGLQAEFMLGMFEDSRIPFYIHEFAGNVSDEEQYARSVPEMLGLLDKNDLHAYDAIADRLVSNIKQRNEERELKRTMKGRLKRGRKKKKQTEEKEDEGDRLSLLKLNRSLGNVSWVIFDNGGASVYNTEAVNEMGHEYLTRKSMNKTDLLLVEKGEPVEVEPGLVCWSETFEASGRTKYIFYADYLADAKTSAVVRKVERMAQVAKDLKDGLIEAESLVTVKNNEFIDFDVKVNVQQILTEYTEEEKAALVEKYKGRYCGFFHLESSAPLTPEEAIRKYRKRIAVEHAMKSLKNVAGIKPLRVWKDASITGRMVLALLTEAILSAIRYEYPEDRVKVTRKGRTAIMPHRPDNKSLCRILTQLTVTYFTREDRTEGRVLSGSGPEIVGIFKRMEGRKGPPKGLEAYA